jgi:thiol-activated cytolysin
MKTLTLKTLAITGLSLLSLNSCKRDEAGAARNTDLSQLSGVSYEVKPDAEVSATPTGLTSIDPVSGKAKKQYTVLTQKSSVFDKPILMREAAIEPTLLYPGSILKGSSFMQGTYDPLVLSNAFKPVTLFLNIKGTGSVTKDNVLPKGSTMFQAISDLQLGNENRFPIDYVPGNYSFESTKIDSEESFKKSLSIHVKADYAKIVSASFDYDKNSSTVQKNSYVMVKLAQTVYSAGIDPKYATDWLEGGVDVAQCGSHEPVYVSSVDYGRVAYLLIETSMTASEVSTMIKASLNVKLGSFSGSADLNYSTQFKSLFNSSKVKVSVLGGPANVVTNYDQFMNYISLESSPSALIKTSAPISYTVRRLKDNSLVNFVNYYKESRLEYRD